MGKKIPKSRRHKKLKSVDLFYKGKRRDLLDRGASKANAKPMNPDVQEVPRRMRELFMSQQLLKDSEKKEVGSRRDRKRKVANDVDEFHQVYQHEEDCVPGMPIFKRLPGESDYHLMHRISLITQSVIEDSKLEAKFDNRTEKQVLDDAEKNDGALPPKQLTVINVERRKVSDVRRKKRKDFEEKKKEKKRLKVEDRKGDFSHLKDNVHFGEVSVQPPLLSSKPRKAQNVTSSSKPGKKDLLLKKMVGAKQTVGIQREIDFSVSPSTTVGTHLSKLGVDRTVKRKLLSVADRRKLDQEQNNAVQAYRNLKHTQQMRKSNAKGGRHQFKQDLLPVENSL